MAFYTMDIDEDIPPFLTLPFDWFVVENWNRSSTETRHEQHIRLGTAFARLGHYGRQPFMLLSWEFIYKRVEARDREGVASVPHDLLTDVERRICKNWRNIWLRTDYSPGTDERHKEFVTASGDIPWIMDENVVSDASRYCFKNWTIDDIDLIYAYFPHLLLYDVHDVGSPEETHEFHFPPILAAKDLQALRQHYFYVLDAEAMRTGFLLWIQPDEFGNVIQWNRIQPWSLMEISGHVNLGFGLHESRGTYENGPLPKFGVKKDEIVIGPWEPPVDTESKSEDV